jgi:VCBS repeat-containing protein
MKVQHPIGGIGALGIAGVLAFGLCSGPVHAQSVQAHKSGRMSHSSVSAEQAKAAALKKYPGTVEGKIALENEDGKWQYAVNVRSGKTLREVMVDAHTGKIASVEVTTKAEEAREAKAEAAKVGHGHKGATKSGSAHPK